MHIPVRSNAQYNGPSPRNHWANMVPPRSLQWIVSIQSTSASPTSVGDAPTIIFLFCLIVTTYHRMLLSKTTHATILRVLSFSSRKTNIFVDF